MAQAITVQHGDTLSRILKEKRGLNAHEIYPWQRKIAKMNPHISDMNRIFPGERVLIPESLNENILRHWIWQNAFSRIPDALSQPFHGSTLVYFVQPGDTIDAVSQYMFSSGPYHSMPASSKRALLIHNNPFLENHLDNGQLSAKMMLNITPAKLSEFDLSYWQREQNPLKSYLDQMQQDTRDLFEQVGPEPTTTAARVVEYLKHKGASVGLDDVVQKAGYGMAGVSGHAAAGTMALANVNTLARELYNEAIETFGSKIVHSKSTNHIARMQNFLKGHTKYAQLMRLLQQLPKHLMPKGISLVPDRARSHVSAARHFRKHIALPLKKWNNSTRYINTVAKQLNGRLSFLKSVGRYGTWYIPATLGLISVFSEPPEMRMRTLFKEGFGVLGGAAGTYAGTALGGLVAISILGLGPFGLFVAVFICASVMGMVGMKIGNKIGAGIYDLGTESGAGQLYYSPQHYLEQIQ